MSRITFVGVLFVGFCLSAYAQAADYCAKPLGQELRCTRCNMMPCFCCDDYCPKSMPCIPCVKPSCLCDDYCPKPMPCIPCVKPSCLCDDYCPKPMPKLCWPIDRCGYKCVPDVCTKQPCRK